MRSRGVLCVFAASVVLAWLGAPGSVAVPWPGFANGAGTAVPHWKVWLCKPGLSPDYCRANLNSTVIYANGVNALDTVSIPKNRPVDCFYVYPTVSQEKRGNADLRIQIAEKAIALTEAAQFEQACRVFAPMYRQVPGVGDSYHPNYALEYDDVLATWRDYLAHDNDGRGVVLIGHSEGSFVLKELIQRQIERSPSERKLLVSAILVGGDVTVRDGSEEGGDFTDVPACRSRTQTACVVAYSTWDRTPPKNAAFEDAASGQRVLCVNPASPGGGTAPITPLFPWFDSNGLGLNWTSPPVPTVFMAFPGLYTARCVEQGSRAWLLVRRVTGPTDPRPTVQAVLNPTWGLHAADVSIDLANLVLLVESESKAWLAHR